MHNNQRDPNTRIDALALMVLKLNELVSQHHNAIRLLADEVEALQNIILEMHSYLFHHQLDTWAATNNNGRTQDNND